MIAAVTSTVGPFIFASAAHAAETVTYEVVSHDIGVVNIEYADDIGRKLVNDVKLPWRMDVPVNNPESQTSDGAQLRADWRPAARPSKWVTVRISFRGKVVCQSTLDVGNATCYGGMSYIT